MKSLLSLTLILFGVGVYFFPEDPRLMNYVIMGLYTISALWWLAHLSLPDFCYWVSAFAITATVTFGYTRH